MTIKVSNEVRAFLRQIAAIGGAHSRGKPKTGRSHESFVAAARAGAAARWGKRKTAKNPVNVATLKTENRHNGAAK